MGDREWFCVETPSGEKLALDKLSRSTEFPNRDAANAAAKQLAEQYAQPLTVVKYTRREIRTFTRRVTIEEADLPVLP